MAPRLQSRRPRATVRPVFHLIIRRCRCDIAAGRLDGKLNRLMTPRLARRLWPTQLRAGASR